MRLCAAVKPAHELFPLEVTPHPPIFPFCFITFQVFKCASCPPPSRLKCIVGRIMENYPVYKKLLKSGGTPLPNDTEAITVCFNTLFIGRDLSRGPLTVGMRLIWFTLPYPPAAQSSPSCHCLIYSVSVCDDCVLASTEDEGRERERRGKKRARKHVFVFISQASSEKRVSATRVTRRDWEMRLKRKKGRWRALPRRLGAVGELCIQQIKVIFAAFPFSENNAIVECHKRSKRILNKNPERWCDLFLSRCFISPDISSAALLPLCPLLALELWVGLLLIGFRLQR